VGFIFHAHASMHLPRGFRPIFSVRMAGHRRSRTGLSDCSSFIRLRGLVRGRIFSERWQRRGFVDAPLRVAIPCAIGILLSRSGDADAHRCLVAGADRPGNVLPVLPMGTVGAALTVIFPNQVRAQVSALYLFILNLGGLTLGRCCRGCYRLPV